jgi:cation diffusion facilitator CzcD-associated flavoprotein CzcO
VETFDVVDVVIVGAGPTGLACGIELKRRGVRAVLIDKGCVVNSLYNYPTNMVFFTTPELLEIGDIPMTSLNEKPIIISSTFASINASSESLATTALSSRMRWMPRAARARTSRRK